MIRSVKDLMLATARRLTGQDVAIVLKHHAPPVVEGERFLAHTIMSLDWQPTITIYEEPRPGNKQAETFLHECAHCLMHAKFLAPKPPYDPRDQATHDADDPSVTAFVNRAEVEAKALAEKWLSYAAEHVRSWERENFPALLLALLSAPKGADI